MLGVPLAGFVGQATSSRSTCIYAPVSHGGERVGAMQGVGRADQHAAVCANRVTCARSGHALVVGAPVINGFDIIEIWVLRNRGTNCQPFRAPHSTNVHGWKLRGSTGTILSRGGIRLL